MKSRTFIAKNKTDSMIEVPASLKYAIMVRIIVILVILNIKENTCE